MSEPRRAGAVSGPRQCLDGERGRSRRAVEPENARVAPHGADVEWSQSNEAECSPTLRARRRWHPGARGAAGLLELPGPPTCSASRSQRAGRRTGHASSDSPRAGGRVLPFDLALATRYATVRAALERK